MRDSTGLQARPTWPFNLAEHERGRRPFPEGARLAAALGILVAALAGATAVAAPAQAAAPVQAAARPNVIYLLADDLGWGDLSVHGGVVPTPAIDRLFSQGVELRNFLGWCVCSPTRAMLLTGRHPFRVGTGPEVGGELAKEETTLAEAFQAHGYRTGIFGKWHNGEDPDTPAYRAAFAEAFKNMPNKQFIAGHGVNAHGFDEAWVYYGGGADYFTRRTVQGRGPVSWWHNLEYRPQDAGYTDDLITQRAIEFLRANQARPFFCYVSYHLVHAPLQAKEEDLAAVDPKAAAGFPAAQPNVTAEDKRIHAAMLRTLDKSVAAILAEVDRLGLRDNTIVLFTSDNGAMQAGSSLPLRGAKHSIYDGGVRLPAVIHWPRGGLSGGRKWEGLCGALDMFPTLMAMTGLTMPPTRPLDGKNVWPALRDNQPSPVESYYWVWRNEDALRTAEWKLHRFFDHFELYDIRTDPSEATNVAAAHPEVVKALTAKMDAWAQSLGAALSHQPPPRRLDARPAPEGEVLEVSLTVTAQARPADQLVVPFAAFPGAVQATDYVEFDLAAGRDSLPQGFYYSPFIGNDGQRLTLEFRRGLGIDQFNREQALGPAPQGGPAVWEHRVIGLCSSAPGALPRHGLVFKGGKPGTYRVYLDNLRIRHADGRTTPIWTGAKDTRTRKIEDSAAFTQVRVRTVPAADVQP